MHIDPGTLDCYINLIAASHRVPSFLVLNDWNRLITFDEIDKTPEQRILMKWLLHDEQMRGESQHNDMRLIIWSLKHGDLFLTALSQSLDDKASETFSDRRQVIAKHAKIMCNWLETIAINEIASLSITWKDLRYLKATNEVTMSKLWAKELQDDVDVKTAWQIMQSNILANNFRKILFLEIKA